MSSNGIRPVAAAAAYNVASAGTPMIAPPYSSQLK